MTISTSNIALSELNTEPGGSTYSNMRFSNLAQPGWNEGTLGSGSFGNYTWGLAGASSGADAIYGLTPTSGAFSIGNFAGLTYYFDGSTFDVTYRYTNSLTVPGPPNPPTSNDIQVEFVFTDSALNYSIFGGPNTPPNFFSSLNMPANSSQATTTVGGIVPNQFVLPRDVYWIIRVNTDPVNFGGGQLDFSINSTSLLTGIGLSPGANDFDSGTYGSALTNSAGILMDFSIY
jgi:hypothetical protein